MSDMLCTRDGTQMPVAGPCDSCGHASMVHPGVHNPGLATCVICELLSYTPSLLSLDV